MNVVIHSSSGKTGLQGKVPAGICYVASIPWTGFLVPWQPGRMECTSSVHGESATLKPRSGRVPWLMSHHDNSLDLTAAAAKCREYFDRFQELLGQRLVLPKQLVEQVMIGLLADGHLLFEGQPGLGKRSVAAALAELANLSFAPVACTPDMDPADLTGIEQFREDPDTGARAYHFMPGPLFSNVLFVEDIHAASSKSLAILVDAMRRRQVGHGRTLQDLPAPFAVIATVPPGSEETDRLLAETVTDRFLLKVSFGYPTGSDEWEIGRRGGAPASKRDPLISAHEVIQLRKAAATVAMPDEVLGYAWALTRATRPGNDLAPDFVETWIRLGISPQGLTALIAAAKARALLHGRTSSTRRDIYESSQPVFQHRLRGNEEALAAGLTVDRLIGMLQERITLDGEYGPQPAP